MKKFGERNIKFLGELYAVDRSFLGPGVSHSDDAKLVRRVDGVGMVCLGPIMIVRRYPEEWQYGTGQLGFQGAGEGKRGQRLVDRIQRTSKESGLLASRYHQTALLHPGVEALVRNAVWYRHRPERCPASVGVETGVQIIEFGVIGRGVPPGGTVVGRHSVRRFHNCSCNTPGRGTFES